MRPFSLNLICSPTMSTYSIGSSFLLMNTLPPMRVMFCVSTIDAGPAPSEAGKLAFQVPATFAGTT
ncbi:hypothetical protein D3C83_253270 [compost metagenome]